MLGKFLRIQSSLGVASVAALASSPHLECPYRQHYRLFWMTESLTDAEIHHQLEISRYLVFIPLTIAVYEYAATFEEEVSRYWGTRLTWGTVLFYINRYSAIFGTVPILAELLLTTTDPRKAAVCDGFQQYHEYFALLSQMLVSAMLIMRTYALYERSKVVLVFTISVTVCAVVSAIALILAGHSRDTLDPRLKTLGCPSATPHDMNMRIAWAWSGMLVFDVMIFLLTLYKALKYVTRRGSLISVLIRGGALYFIIMIVVNAANIATYTMGGPIISGAGTTALNVISSVLLTRLMLNLRDPNILRMSQRTRTTRDTTTEGTVPTTTFTEAFMGTDIVLDSVWIPEHSIDGGEHNDNYEMHAMTSDPEPR
ncbi:hypothetical protein DFH06DRAFT_653886 [Mycena polygramma]|nr:hypothetical protein DFH06DRAFT_653886 [Mycena polygramma]